MSQKRKVLIQSRVDWKETWEDTNPVLLEKEIGYEKETGKYKIGDAIHGWNQLTYASSDTGRATENGGEIFNDYENNIASGEYSHAEGNETSANGNASHAEGTNTVATGGASHAEGDLTEAIGMNSHAEGVESRAVGIGSHAEGYRSFAGLGGYQIESYELVDDYKSKIIIYGLYLSEIKEGCLNMIVDSRGEYIDFSDNDIHVEESEGKTTVVVDSPSLYYMMDSCTEPYVLVCTSGPVQVNFSHAEGYESLSFGEASHAEGYRNKASGMASHAEGNYTNSSGSYSHAEGYSTNSIGDASHAEGNSTHSPGQASHAEGNYTNSSGDASHAEGSDTYAEGEASHSEGIGTVASGNRSHAEGMNSQSTADDSHSEGYSTISSGVASHSEGYKTVANQEGQHVQGKFNKYEDENGNPLNYADVVGNGTSDTARSNAYTLDWNGNAWFAGTIETTGIKLPTFDLTIQTPFQTLTSSEKVYYYYDLIDYIDENISEKYFQADLYNLVIDLKPLNLDNNLNIIDYLEMKQQFDYAEILGATYNNKNILLITGDEIPTRPITLEIKAVKK